MKKLFLVLFVMALSMVTVFAQGAAEAAPKAVAAESNGTPENPVELTLLLKDLGDYLEMLDVLEVELAKDGIYVKFNPVQLQEGSYQDAMGLVLNSGVVADLIYFQGGDYAFGITQGILEDLRPYVENSKYLKDYLYPHSVARLENYPYLVWATNPGNKLPLVRTDWLEKMETGKALLENPSVDNYYAFLKEIQEKFTGKYAFILQGATDGLYELDMVFGQAFGATQTWVKGADGKYVHKNVSDAELAKLEFYAKLYREGLLDPEYLSKKYAAKEQAFYTGEVGVVVGTQNTVVPKYENKMIAANGETATLTVLPPAAGPDGASYLNPVAVDKNTRGWAIHVASQHKQLVFDILDWLAGPRGVLLDQFGFEGVHYQITDGKIEILDSSWWPRFHEDLNGYLAGVEFTGSIIPLSKKPVMAEATAMAAEHTVLDNAFIIPDEYATEWDAATIIYKEFAADFVSGKKTAADWSAFVAEWNAMGGKAVTEYANKVL